jgi:2-dehydro-3-deoxy-D-arabinonate dehydratase
MSSRDIEGANPLYLPQAKVYRQCCALGPAITLHEEASDIPAATIRVGIERNRNELWSGATSAQQMKRTFEDLIEYLGRDNLFPEGVILLTGTGLVPPDDITLQAGDVVIITIDGIGTLSNAVVQG